jgi:hypothetical protein
LDRWRNLDFLGKFPMNTFDQIAAVAHARCDNELSLTLAALAKNRDERILAIDAVTQSHMARAIKIMEAGGFTQQQIATLFYGLADKYAVH